MENNIRIFKWKVESLQNAQWYTQILTLPGNCLNAAIKWAKNGASLIKPVITQNNWHGE
jgi:hypothetical protein